MLQFSFCHIQVQHFAEELIWFIIWKLFCLILCMPNKRHHPHTSSPIIIKAFENLNKKHSSIWIFHCVLPDIVSDPSIQFEPSTYLLQNHHPLLSRLEWPGLWACLNPYKKCHPQKITKLSEFAEMILCNMTFCVKNTWRLARWWQTINLWFAAVFFDLNFTSTKNLTILWTQCQQYPEYQLITGLLQHWIVIIFIS